MNHLKTKKPDKNELKGDIDKMKNGKAPDIDGVPVDGIMEVVTG